MVAGAWIALGALFLFATWMFFDGRRDHLRQVELNEQIFGLIDTSHSVLDETARRDLEAYLSAGEEELAFDVLIHLIDEAEGFELDVASQRAVWQLEMQFHGHLDMFSRPVAADLNWISELLEHTRIELADEAVLDIEGLLTKGDHKLAYLRFADSIKATAGLHLDTRQRRMATMLEEELLGAVQFKYERTYPYRANSRTNK